MTAMVPPALARMYVINLERSVDRLRRFLTLNLHLANHVARVTAVDGTRIDREALIGSGLITADLPYGSGTLGCALSHISLWQRAVRKYRPITVFEDDVVVHPRFLELAGQVLAALPDDWDFVQWGCPINAANNLAAWVDLGRTTARIDSTGAVRWRDAAGYAAFQAQPLRAAAPIRLLHAFGLFAYSLSPKGAHLACNHCLPLRSRDITLDGRWSMRDDGIDVTMCGLYPNIKAFLAFPQLAIPCVDDPSERQGADAV